MRIIKVSATESTNTLAREWYQSNKKDAPFCVVANVQTSGRGQRGASWVSNAGENLTFSMVFPHPEVEISDQFIISACVGMAVLKSLKSLKISRLKLKWPNDIMAANNKIGGILIENILSNGSIIASVIGVGLNINQMQFSSLPHASSLKIITGEDYNLEELLKAIILDLEHELKTLGSRHPEMVIAEYEEVLFRRNKVSTFQLKNGSLLTGIIRGITPSGLLNVHVEEEGIRTFDLKELKLLL